MTAPHRPLWLLALLARWDDVNRRRGERLTAVEAACLIVALNHGAITAADLGPQRCSRATVAELRHLSGLDQRDPREAA